MIKNEVEMRDDVQGCLAIADAVPLASLIVERPALKAEIRRIAGQAKTDPAQRSAFASFVDLPILDAE